MKEHYIKIVDNFGFPLLAIDIMGCKCIRPELNLLQLLGPVVDFIGYEMEVDIGDVLKASHAATAGGAFVCAQQNLSYWGSAMFPVPFMLGELAENKSYHEALLAIGNLLALLLLTDKAP